MRPLSCVLVKLHGWLVFLIHAPKAHILRNFPPGWFILWNLRMASQLKFMRMTWS